MPKPIIDLSYANGEVNFSKLSGYDFIIRAGYGNSISQKDSQFNRNIQNAIAIGANIGLYWFSYADSPTDAAKEFYACNEIISPYKQYINMPVFFDWENASFNYFQKIHGVKPTADLINNIAFEFLTLTKSNGYLPGLYTNKDYYRLIWNSLVKKYGDIWLADLSGAPTYPCSMQQNSQTAHITGITGTVDTDIAFKSFQKSNVIKCDTGGTIVKRKFDVYTAKFSGSTNINVWTADTTQVLVLPRYSSGNDAYFYIIPIGTHSSTGIYATAAGYTADRKFIVKIP